MDTLNMTKVNDINNINDVPKRTKRRGHMDISAHEIHKLTLHWNIPEALKNKLIAFTLRRVSAGNIIRRISQEGLLTYRSESLTKENYKVIYNNCSRKQLYDDAHRNDKNLVFYWVSFRDIPIIGTSKHSLSNKEYTRIAMIQRDNNNPRHVPMLGLDWNSNSNNSNNSTGTRRL